MVNLLVYFMNSTIKKNIPEKIAIGTNSKAVEIRFDILIDILYLYIKYYFLQAQSIIQLSNCRTASITSNYYLSMILMQGIRIAYIPFFMNEDVPDQRVGAFSQSGLAEKMKLIDVAVSQDNNKTYLTLGLRNGLRDIIIGPKREMPAFEL